MNNKKPGSHGSSFENFLLGNSNTNVAKVDTMTNSFSCTENKSVADSINSLLLHVK